MTYEEITYSTKSVTGETDIVEDQIKEERDKDGEGEEGQMGEDPV